MTPSCPRCGAPASFALRATDRNRTVSNARFDYWRCSACEVLWLPDVPGDLAAYYPSDYHASMAPGDLENAIAAEQPRIDLITRHVERGQMVEIGPSQGIFASAAKRAGFDLVAMEMDADCCRQLENLGLRAINTAAPQDELPALEPSRAVVLWHVIEHLPDPWSVLRAIAANLEPGGVLALATPNPDAFQFRVFGARWVHLDAPRHLTLIPLTALCHEAQQLGLRVVSATASDPVGLQLNRLGWERSFLRPPALRSDPRLAYTIGHVFRRTLGAWEARGLRGAGYTALFVKQAGSA
jgi:SAM-dependent methyltransferase